MNASRSSRSLLCALIMIGCAIAPPPAEAHLNSTGMGPIYDGITHFLLSPDDLVPALAVAMLAGLRGASYGRRVMFVLPAAWLLGAALGVTASTTISTFVFAAVWFVALGGLVAADVALSLRVITGLAALLGLHHGFVNGAGIGQPGVANSAVLGLAAAVFVLVALGAAFVVRLQAHSARIAVRVAGSWIAACGLLMFGWAVRTHYFA